MLVCEASTCKQPLALLDRCPCTRRRLLNYIVAGGDTPALITKESASRYALYASGRRFCQSMSLTLNLIKRQDFIYTLAQLVTPQDDELEVEVQMTESTMPQLVLAIATPKLARSLQKEESSLPGIRLDA